jgi:putative tryptophan/tyrosine transport system substrate-binding protein
LVRLNVDVIVVGASAAIPFVQQATSTIPIVMGYSIDPVGNGFVANLARPGGNITGLSSTQEDIVSEHIELLTTAIPQLSRVAILLNPGNVNHLKILEHAKIAASNAGVRLVSVVAPNLPAFMSKQGARALVVLPDSFFTNNRGHIAELALIQRLPSIFAQREYVEAGGLMSYGESFREFLRRAATFVEKIFRGSKASDLPIEQPTRYFLVVNLKTAKALGLTLPPSLIARADEIIE